MNLKTNSVSFKRFFFYIKRYKIILGIGILIGIILMGIGIKSEIVKRSDVASSQSEMRVFIVKDANESVSVKSLVADYKVLIDSETEKFENKNISIELIDESDCFSIKCMAVNEEESQQLVRDVYSFIVNKSYEIFPNIELKSIDLVNATISQGNGLSMINYKLIMFFVLPILISILIIYFFMIYSNIIVCADEIGDFCQEEGCELFEVGSINLINEYLHSRPEIIVICPSTLQKGYVFNAEAANVEEIDCTEETLDSRNGYSIAIKMGETKYRDIENVINIMRLKGKELQACICVC